VRPDFRLLLCATDAGGAANVAALLPALTERQVEVMVMTARHLTSRFDGSPTLRLICVAPEEVEAAVQAFRPGALVCGTTRYDSPERRLLAIAARRGIRSVAVLDERYLYRQRFETAAGEVEAWPDLVTLIDETSREEAIAEGLPPDRLRVTGSPGGAAPGAASRLEHTPPPRPDVLPPAADGPSVTFLSETLATDYGTGPDTPGMMGPFVGYTEHTVRELLIEALAALQRPVALVEKLHPADLAPVSSSRQVGAVRVIVVRDVQLWPLLWHSEAVVGMRSMALLEAYLLGVPVLSFQPGLTGPERCSAVRLGLVPQTTRQSHARAWLASTLGARPSLGRGLPGNTGSFAPPDAARRIVALALGDAP
jgi:hypothetical protein